MEERGGRVVDRRKSRDSDRRKGKESDRWTKGEGEWQKQRWLGQE